MSAQMLPLTAVIITKNYNELWASVKLLKDQHSAQEILIAMTVLKKAAARVTGRKDPCCARQNESGQKVRRGRSLLTYCSPPSCHLLTLARFVHVYSLLFLELI